MEVIFVSDKTDKPSLNRFAKWVAETYAKTVPGFDHVRDWQKVADMFVIYKPSEFSWDDCTGFPVFCGAEVHAQFCDTKRQGMHDRFCVFPSVGTVLMLSMRKDARSIAQRDIVVDLALASLSKANGVEPVSTMTQTMFVMNPDRFGDMLERIQAAGEFCFDFETKPRTAGLKTKADLKKASLDFNRSVPTMLGISFQVGSGWILPLWHHQSPWNVGYDTEFRVEGGRMFIDNEMVCRYDGTPVAEEEDPDMFALVSSSISGNITFACIHGYHNLIQDYLVVRLLAVFTDQSLRKIAHNVAFDYKVARKMGLRVVGPLWDTRTLDHYLQEDREHGLKDIANRMYPEFAGYEDDVDYANGDLVELGEYCAKDNDLTLRLCYLMEREMIDDKAPNEDRPNGKVYRAYRSLEVPKCAMLCEMEYGGMKVDRKVLEASLDDVAAKIQTKREAIMSHPVVRKFVAARNGETVAGIVEELEGKTKAFVDAKLSALKAKELPKEGTKAREKHDLHVRLMEEEEWFHPDFPYKQVTEWATKAARASAGEVTAFEFNLGSSQQLSELIYTHPAGLSHKMPVAVATRKDKETGKNRKVKQEMPSVNKDYLQELEDETGIIADIITLGVLDTLMGTYLQGIADTLDYDDCTHSSFSTVKTHRLSSSNPNLQNIPSRTKVKEVKDAVANIKRMFIPHRQGDYEMHQADLSQAELRWAAEIWQVSSMKKAFREKIDLHILASCNANDLTMEQYFERKKTDLDWAEMFRFEGKADNFGLIFKASPAGYRDYAKKTYGLNLTMTQAEHHHKSYFKLHPDVLRGHALFLKKAQVFGYVRTKFGVKRHTPNIHDPNPTFRSADERVSANSPIQGSSGQGMLFSLAVYDTIRMPMLLGHLWRTEARLVNTVHDSAVGWHRMDLRDIVLHWLVKTMNCPPTKEYFGFDFADVMMVTDVETGPNWKDLKKH